MTSPMTKASQEAHKKAKKSGGVDGDITLQTTLEKVLFPGFLVLQGGKKEADAGAGETIAELRDEHKKT